MGMDGGAWWTWLVMGGLIGITWLFAVLVIRALWIAAPPRLRSIGSGPRNDSDSGPSIGAIGIEEHGLHRGHVMRPDKAQ